MSKKYQKYVFSPLDYYRNKYQVICGGDLRDKTFFEKKIVQKFPKITQNNIQKWISKDDEIFTFSKIEFMLEAITQKSENFRQNLYGF